MALQIEEVVSIAKKSFVKLVGNASDRIGYLDIDDVAQNVALSCLQGFENVSVRTRYEVLNARRTALRISQDKAFGCEKANFCLQSDSEELWELVATLPPVQAEVVRLRFLDGLNLPAIGRLVGLSVPTVAGLLREAFTSLRKELSK